MGTLASSNNIARLLRMKGNKRLQIRDEITEGIIRFPYELRTGGMIDLQFLESRSFESDYGQWNEYSALFKIRKINESAPYIGAMFETMSYLSKTLGLLKNDGFGIQEVECGLPDYYYILIYIIRNNGKEREPEDEGWY